MLSEDGRDIHVLVIGSSGAGVRAGIGYSHDGTTLLVSKTLVGKGGCIRMADGGHNTVMQEAGA